MIRWTFFMIKKYFQSFLIDEFKNIWLLIHSKPSAHVIIFVRNESHLPMKMRHKLGWNIPIRLIWLSKVYIWNSNCHFSKPSKCKWASHFFISLEGVSSGNICNCYLKYFANKLYFRILSVNDNESYFRCLSQIYDTDSNKLVNLSTQEKCPTFHFLSVLAFPLVKLINWFYRPLPLNHHQPST